MKVSLALVWIVAGLFAGSALCLFPRPADAAKIRFPDEELSSETVLPLFQPVRAVLNRNINLKHRLEAVGGVTFGWDEPFRFIYYPFASVSFYLTDTHGLSLTGMYLPPFYSSAGKKLAGRTLLAHFNNPSAGGGGPKQAGALGVCDMPRTALRPEDCQQWKLLDIHRVPYPHIMGFLNYVYTPYYGKISLTKHFVMNLSIYGFIGPGLVVFNENSKTPAFNLGIGKRLYFSRWIALRADIGFYVYRGPDLTRIPPQLVKTKEEVQNFVNNNEQIHYSETPKSFWPHLTAGVGLVFLL